MTARRPSGSAVERERLLRAGDAAQRVATEADEARAGLAAAWAPRANMGDLPLSLVPTFGVPLWLIFHMISLLQLRRMRG